MLTLAELEQIVRDGRESTAIEFKGVGSFGNPGLRAQVVRGAMGLSNARDGGLLIIGMVPDEARPGFWTASGLNHEQASSFEPDAVSEQVNSHVSPFLDLTTGRFDLSDGKCLVVVQIAQFADYPSLCTKDVIGDSNRTVVRKGALLVRSRRKPETTEIQSPDDLRHLVDLATELAIARNARLRSIESTATGEDSAALFRTQLGDF